MANMLSNYYDEAIILSVRARVESGMVGDSIIELNENRMGICRRKYIQ